MFYEFVQDKDDKLSYLKYTAHFSEIFWNIDLKMDLGAEILERYIYLVIV